MNSTRNVLRLIGTLALSAALLWLLASVFGESSREIAAPGQNLPNASATAYDLPPSPLPPTDDGVRVPPCCPETLVYVTPDATEREYLGLVATQEANLTQMAARNSQVEATFTPIPPIIYLTPSLEWGTYKDPFARYIFEYPANWFVATDSVGQQKAVAVSNFPLSQVGKQVPSPDRLKAIIFPAGAIAPYESLEEYVNDPARRIPAGQLLSQKTEVLPNGYVIVWQRWSATTDILVAYITNGNSVFEVISSSSSTYEIVVEHIVYSLAIP